MSEFMPSKVSIKDRPLYVKSTIDKMTFQSVFIVGGMTFQALFSNVLVECSPNPVHVKTKCKRTNSKLALSHSSKELPPRPWCV